MKTIFLSKNSHVYSSSSSSSKICLYCHKGNMTTFLTSVIKQGRVRDLVVLGLDEVGLKKVLDVCYSIGASSESSFHAVGVLLGGFTPVVAVVPCVGGVC